MKNARLPRNTFRVPEKDVCNAVIPTNFTSFEDYLDIRECDWDHHICCFGVGPKSIKLARETCNYRLKCISSEGSMVVILVVMGVILCLLSCMKK